MADIKVSGLTAVASFLTTHELPVNEAGTSKKVTGAQIVAVVAQGTVPSGYVQVVANQGGITTAVDVTSLTVTATFAAGRRIRITAQAVLTSTTAGDQVAITIMEGATQLSEWAAPAPAAVAGITGLATVVIQPSAGAHTYKLQAHRVGVGTMVINASTSNPAYFHVEDLGAN